MKKTILDYTLKIRLPITIFTIVAAFALTYYISRPERDSVGYSPEQPIHFSHKLHAGNMKIDCQYCHVGADKERHATIPSANICMNCHTVARRGKPEIIKLVKYFEDNKPIEWKRIHKLAKFTYFNHSVHVNKNIDCKHCHGDVAGMDVLTQVQPFTMGDCLNCHRNAKKKMPELGNKISNGPENCWACHR